MEFWKGHLGHSTSWLERPVRHDLNGEQEQETVVNGRAEPGDATMAELPLYPVS